jgi:hypothetical protein
MPMVTRDSGANRTDGAGSLLFVGPQKHYGMQISFLTGSSQNDPPVFLLFFTGNYQRGSLLLRRNPGRRLQSKQNNSELSVCSAEPTNG